MASQSLDVPLHSAMASATSRAVSVAVPSQHTHPSSSRRQQRASHSVTTSAHHEESQNSPYSDVYHHPAVEAYAAAHPRRTIPRFGPYLLLQTLGEGEFGKVKLGIHVQWGEEVAVKLIRRGNVDNAVRLSKVEREIEVLRTLKHPNIVRLYDVIETDKYIGIILEYASGGELFDHILAHRYLKERDAAKLFSQLISGVWYIHQKKIVHRDLKLENLLLDRNRNVIITDFGFANRFEHKADDLMQTSCGSPCYAAPELVISEGLYVGSAVDIWSCGVILYAMLAGYLPFDDDPANPDGDNINLLYKYIVSTPLSFPEYISTDARDLLSMMLVPDPTRRANLDGVMRHRWLSAHAGPSRTDGSPNAFGRNVDELEKVALDQHQQRRLAYQRQMRAAAISQQSPSHHGREATHSGVPSRSRSTQPEYLYESSADQPPSAPPAATRSNTTSGVTPNGKKPTYGSPSAHGITADDPFAPPPPASSLTAAANAVSSSANVPARISEEKPAVNGTSATSPSQSSKGHKQNSSSGGGGGAFRHTIQVEYDDRNSGSKRSDEKRARAATEHQSQAPAQQQQSSRDRRASGSTKPLPASPPLPTPSTATAPQPTSATPSTSPATAPAPEKPPQPPAKPSSSSPPRSAVPTFSVSTPPTPGPAPDSTPSTTDGAKEKETSSSTSSVGKKSGISPAPTQRKGHKKGRSSVDRFALSKIFGSGGNSGRASADALNAPAGGGEKEKSASSLLTASPERYGDKETKEKSPSPTRSPTTEKTKDASKGDGEKKKTRRNTLTVMVEPISRTIRGGRSKNSATPQSAHPDSTNAPNASSASLAPPAPPSIPGTPTPSGKATTSSKGGVSGDGGSASAASFGGLDGGSSIGGGGGTTDTTTERDRDENGRGGAGNAASSSKAKKVMAWFRTKSKGRDSMGLSGGTTASSSHSSGEEGGEQQVLLTAGGPAVTLTTPTSQTATKIAPPQTPRVAAPGHPKRSASTNTESSVFSTPGFVQKFRNSVGVGIGGPSTSSKHASMNTPSRARKPSHTNTNTGGHVATKQKHPYEKLRIHHGAVDQTTITTRPPSEVMLHVKEILEGMGVMLEEESEFKYRCVRQKKKKGVVGVPAGGASGSGGGSGEQGTQGGGEREDVAAFTMVGSAASNGVDKRGLPIPSQSSSSFGAPGNMLRGLWMRRQSSQVSTNTPSSGAANANKNKDKDAEGLAFDDENSVVVSPSTPISATSPGVDKPPVVMMVGETAYGDPTQDAGDEVRFSVELTRIDRLNDTFSLDIRRLKGNLRSYKFLYDTIRQRADLQRLGQ